jgi:iron complex outermembrane receptor protein
MTHLVKTLGPAVVLAVAAVPAAATDLVGRVVAPGGTLVADARVSLIELRRDATTDGDGRFAFTDVPAGEYLLEVSSLRFGAAVVRVAVSDDTAPVEIELDQRVHAGSISVTVTGRARGLDEIAAPVDVLADEQLALRREATLGDTLAIQPGVAATGYGRGSSRPVIRGLDADRIRILENGLDSGDVSSVGPDHATAVDPLTADQIEVVRGPATLLYGGTAVGGVVNIIDGRVPDRVPVQPVTGSIEIGGGSNADELEGSIKLDGGVGRFAWHVDGFWRDGDDYTSPAPRPGEEHHEGDGHADGEDDEEHEEVVTGRVENSFVEARGGTVGVSWIGAGGYVGVAFGVYESQYGVPGHAHGHGDEDDGHDPETGAAAATLEEEEHDEDGVFIDLEQRRVDVHGRWDAPFGGVEAFQVRVGWRDYDHREMEGDDVGTMFENEFTEARVEALLAPIGRFEGTAGLHWIDRDFAASGDEAYVQPTTTRRLAAFVFEELPPEPWGLQLGARWETQDTSTVDPSLPDRDFDAVSLSGGVSRAVGGGWLASLAVSRSERAPTAEELYSDGPHAATRAYEIGDPDLDTELGTGLELTLRSSSARFEASASLFWTRFDDFVYLADTGMVEDGFDVRMFTQADAEFAGFELHGDLEVVHRGSHHVHIEATLDQVEAELVDTGDYLPRIPPRRALLALYYFGETWNARVEGRWVDAQDRVADFEEPTPDYWMLNASVGFHVLAGGVDHHILLRGTNLTDEAAYNHVSYLKEVAPLPGRNVSLSYRAIF